MGPNKPPTKDEQAFQDAVRETWVAVPGYEGIYEVSVRGRVRSVDRVDSAGRNLRGKILKPWTNGKGYKQVYLASDGQRHPVYVHRLVLEAFVGPCPDGYWAAHNNGQVDDCRLSNLRWDTPKANHADKIRHGTLVNGERNYNARLTESRVRELRESDLPDKYFAEKWNVSKGCIESARKRHSWKHVA